MRIIRFILLFQLLVYSVYSQNVVIPDANFKAYLVGNTSINTNADNEIQLSEANAYTGNISCANLNISSLQGIEAFTNIAQLNCSNNNITTLNLSQNTQLTVLVAQSNQITNVSFGSADTALWYIGLNFNQLTSFNSTQHPLLKLLVLNNNQLTSIDVSQNPLLENLRCDYNQLTSLSLSQNPLVYSLLCNSNQLTNLDISQNPALFNLRCQFNQLTSLDVSQNTILKNLFCYNNQLTNLNVNQNPDLEKLLCSTNALTSLDVSQNVLLNDLQCGFNLITNLDVTNNPNLTRLLCPSNQLTYLNVNNGNNGNLEVYNSLDNQQLSCIIVDNATYSTTNWLNKDATATFVNTLAGCNALSTENFAITNGIKVYPNPATSHITISYSGDAAMINLFNATGQKVLETKRKNINTKALEPGIYFLKIYFEAKTVTKKVIIN